LNRKKHPQYEPTAKDYAMQRELYMALSQVDGLPYEDQWGLALELLPEEFFCYVMQARLLPEHILMEHLGPLAMMLCESLLGDTQNTEYLTMCLYGLTISCAAELERKYLHFCTKVEAVPNPLTILQDDFVLFHPKDPETFDIVALYDHYTKNHCV
jgi:hypothetical protein